MKQLFKTPNKARAFFARAVVVTLLAVTVATSLGACVYRGEGEGWHHGGRFEGERR